MGIFDEPASPYKPCPECGSDAISNEGGIISKQVVCRNCGNEPELQEVQRSFQERVGKGSEGKVEKSETSPDNLAGDEESRYICRECKEEVAPDVERCPNCGWKPKKRGGIWWGTTALTSLSPIGWIMGAKGAKDNLKASKGVAKRLEGDRLDSAPQIEGNPDEDITRRLKRIEELHEEGLITDSEYEEKRSEILDGI